MVNEQATIAYAITLFTGTETTKTMPVGWPLSTRPRHDDAATLVPNGPVLRLAAEHRPAKAKPVARAAETGYRGVQRVHQ
jgi:hypothetical protein